MEAGVNKGAVSQAFGLQAEEEFRRIQEREDNQDLAATSVIRKFNTNSERILNMLAKQKKPQTVSMQDCISETMDRSDRL